MSDHHTSCDASIEFSEFVQQLLDAYPDALNEVAKGVWCEMRFGHDGLHYAPVQSTPDIDYWAEWDDGAPRLLSVQQGSNKFTELNDHALILNRS